MSNISVGSKFWIEKDGQFFLGKGRVQLLKAIRENGSITAAAKSLSMSYKKAWEAINAMNELSEKPLVTRTTGGIGGGGTVITPDGENAIDLYDGLIDTATAFVETETKLLTK